MVATPCDSCSMYHSTRAVFMMAVVCDTYTAACDNYCLYILLAIHVRDVLCS